MREQQKKSSLTDKESISLNKAKLLKEYNLLNDIKKVIDTDEGLNVFKWIIGLAPIFNDVFTNSGYTAYNLGIQHIGKKIMCKLIDSGCELKITDLAPSLDGNRINSINEALNKLNLEDKK